jgi:hypothetical protein
VLVEDSQDEKQFTIVVFDPIKGRGKVLRTIDKDPTIGPELLRFGSIPMDQPLRFGEWERPRLTSACSRSPAALTASLR